jgi:DNA-directed RNA polymerase subunit alpha
VDLGFEKISVYHDGGESPFEPGKVIIENLEMGFARTIGNSLRRILFRAMPGASVIGLKIPGVSHQFCTIPGTSTDVVELISNLKDTRFKLEKEGVHIIQLVSNKNGVIHAKDLILPKSVETLTPEQELLRVNGTQKVEIDIFVKIGRGYKDSSEHTEFNDIEGVIPVDGVFSPIVKVGYREEPMSIGQNENESFERLILDITTDGSISAKDSVMVAAKIAEGHFNFFEGMSDIAEKINVYQEKKEEENLVLDKTIEQLDLTVRSYNCLNREQYRTVRQIISLSEQELASINQLGEKSVREIIAKVQELGLELRKD